MPHFQGSDLHRSSYPSTISSQDNLTINPIKNLWATLKNRLGKMKCDTKNDLIQSIKKCGCKKKKVFYISGDHA